MNETQPTTVAGVIAATLFAMANAYLIPFATQKWTEVQSKAKLALLQLARKFATEGINWAKNEWKRALRNCSGDAKQAMFWLVEHHGIDPKAGDFLEQLALKHVRRVVEGKLKKWSDYDWLGTIRDVYEDMYPVVTQQELDKSVKTMQAAQDDMEKRMAAADAKMKEITAGWGKLP